MSNKRGFDQSGLTIIELMLGLLITSMVMATFMVITRNYSNSANEFRGSAKLNLSIRSFSDHLNLHASSAGFSPIDSSLSSIVSERPFSLNGSLLAVGTRSGSYSDVISLNFAYDSDKNTREYAFYEVVNRTKKGRAQKQITLTRRFKVGPAAQTTMFQGQLVLDDVLSFRCNQRLVGSTPRAMDCQLVVYVEDAPSTLKTLTHEFTIATLQTY
jgi:hypothetical protein